ncbi:hypothetical protein [Aliidiomarina quisquiliarum]|uniref:hypothetical protein n=1 Tax=Aliidiomarina quisquiliarum TaxID=2938947 RepID=UPI00208F67DE|nr:hypothetical protein [Aliidiomarina quisquiliarum]MCO4321230.1 hypothetical protein [Aliidiomarina quisquiliarum]
MKLKSLYLLFVILALFSFGSFGSDRRIGNFYGDAKSGLTELIRGYMNGDTELSEIKAFMADTRHSWSALYNNQHLQLSDDECGLWLVLWNTLPSFSDQEQAFFRTNARFF